MAPNPDFEALVERCVSLRLEGREDDLRGLINGHPGRAADLRRRLEMADLARTLIQGVDGDPGHDLPPALSRGELIDGFRVLGTLAESAMGRIYLTRQESLDRLAVLKVLRFPRRPPAALERFAREGRILARLQHPHILSVYDVRNHPSVGTYLALPYVRGVSLSAVVAFLEGRRASATSRDVLRFVADRVKKREAALGAALPDPPASPRAEEPLLSFALRLMRQVAQALSAAHARRLIHRDIKPSNILLSSDGNAVLLDFGLTLDGEEQRNTMTGELLGTPLYMPPECWRRDSAAADVRSDLYSLGATFYEVLSGRPPFNGENTLQTLRLIEEGAPSRLSHLPREVETILLKCLERRPPRRHQTAAALDADLERSLSGRPAAPRGPSRPLVSAAGLALAGVIAAAMHARRPFFPAGDPPASTATPAPAKPPAAAEREEPPSPRPETRLPRPASENLSTDGGMGDDPRSLTRKALNTSLEKLRRAVEKGPGFTEARMDMADALERLGYMEEALRERLAAQRNAPPHVDPRGISAVPVPPRWVMFENKPLQTAHFQSPDGRGMFGLRTLPKPKGVPAEKLMRHFHKTLPSEVRILRSAVTTVGGREALVQEIETERNGVRWRGLTMLVWNGENAVFLNGYSREEDHQAFKPYYEEAMHGVRVLFQGEVE